MLLQCEISFALNDHRVLFVFFICFEMYVKMCTLCANKDILYFYSYTKYTFYMY